MCTCMYGWEQRHRVWQRAKHLPPWVVAHREGPGLDGPCIVFEEPPGHAGWITQRRHSDALTENLLLNRRRAETKAEKYQYTMSYEYSVQLNFYAHTVFPRWVQSSSSNSRRTVRAHSSLQALCSTLPNTTHLRTNLKFPMSWKHINGNELAFNRVGLKLRKNI